MALIGNNYNRGLPDDFCGFARCVFSGVWDRYILPAIMLSIAIGTIIMGSYIAGFNLFGTIIVSVVSSTFLAVILLTLFGFLFYVTIITVVLSIIYGISCIFTASNSFMKTYVSTKKNRFCIKMEYTDDQT